MKASNFLLFPFVLALSMVAFGKSLQVSTDSPLREGKFYQLDYKEYIDILGKKDYIRSAPVSQVEIAVLNNYIAEYLKEKNNLLDPETYYYQLVSAINSKGQKLIFVNAVHSSFPKKETNLNKLIMIAD